MCRPKGGKGIVEPRINQGGLGSHALSTALLSAGFLAACQAFACLPVSNTQVLWQVAVSATLLFAALVDQRDRIVAPRALAALLSCGLLGPFIRCAEMPEVLASLGLGVASAIMLAAPVFVLAHLYERRGSVGMGMGDVKLIFALGLCLGLGAGALVLALSCMLAVGHQALCATVERIGGRQGRFLARTMPFVPYLAAASWAILALGGAWS